MVENCVVPALKGKTLAQAKTALAAAKCSVGTVKKTFSAKVKKGRVVRQAVAGRTLAKGAAVGVTLSKAAAGRGGDTSGKRRTAGASRYGLRVAVLRRLRRGPRLLLVATLALVLVAGGCGGNGGPDDGDGSGSEASGGQSAADLAHHAQNAEQIVDHELAEMEGAGSPDDVRSRLEEARAELEALAGEVASADVSGELQAKADQLETDLRVVAEEFGRVAAEVDSGGDVAATVEEVQNLDAVRALRETIDELRRGGAR